MRIFRQAAIYGCLSSLCINAAVAQWNGAATMQLGAGYGRIALSQSILNNTRRITDQARRETTPSRPAPADTDPALTYTPDPSLSAQTRTAMIETLSRSNPALRTQVAQAFAGDGILRTFDQFMSKLGYSSHNVADDMAMLLLVSWEIATDSSASKSQISGADRQVHSLFTNTPALRSLNNAQRQQMAEQIAYQVILGSAAKTDYVSHGDQAQLAHLRELAASIMRQQGLDLRNLQLTEQGFSLKN
jgi:hypothetical protein